MDSVRKLDMSTLKRVTTRKQMSFLMKIISPPPWAILSTRYIRNLSTLNWLLLKVASIFVSVIRSMSNHPDISQLLTAKNLKSAIFALMCPILVLARCLFAIASKEDQMSNCVSRSSFISTELPLVSKLLTSENSGCFGWSKQSRQVQVLVVNCGHPCKRTADKTPSSPLRESVYIRPLPLNKIGETH